MAEEEKVDVKKKGISIKMLIMGLPIFIIQLVLVYVITANILLEKMIEQKLHGGEIDSTLAEELLDPVDEEEEHAAVVTGQFIYNMDDIVVNPAGTQKFLLLSMGFDLPSQQVLTLFEAKQILVRDLILTYLAEKTIDEVSVPAFKSELKATLIEAIKEMEPELTVTTIYFSKYIVN